MSYASNNKIAGPLDIDPRVLARDALIREDNDGEVIDDATVIGFARKNKSELFAQQSAFFGDLRRKLDSLGA
jgi:hypothetical protein